jgi:hypothetical protein
MTAYLVALDAAVSDWTFSAGVVVVFVVLLLTRPKGRA